MMTALPLIKDSMPSGIWLDGNQKPGQEFWDLEEDSRMFKFFKYLASSLYQFCLKLSMDSVLVKAKLIFYTWQWLKWNEER